MEPDSSSDGRSWEGVPAAVYPRAGLRGLWRDRENRVDDLWVHLFDGDGGWGRFLVRLSTGATWKLGRCVRPSPVVQAEPVPAVQEDLPQLCARWGEGASSDTFLSKPIQTTPHQQKMACSRCGGEHSVKACTTGKPTKRHGSTTRNTLTQSYFQKCTIEALFLFSTLF